MKPILLLGLAASTCFAQAQPTPAKPDPAKAGPEIIAEAFGKLTAALTEAIAKGGPENALEVCFERAPEIAAEVGETHGITLRRATTKPRNPKNAADDREKRILAAFGMALDQKQPPKPLTVTNPDGSAVLFAPIVIANPLCLQCHGNTEDDIAPLTLTAISKLYPDDKATNYQLGDLRGLWSVTFPAEK
jgi:hypothetical protein